MRAWLSRDEYEEMNSLQNQRQILIDYAEKNGYEILSEGKISDVNLRMLVNKILIHQNEDKSLDIKFEMNGDFNNASNILIESECQLQTA